MVVVYGYGEVFTCAVCGCGGRVLVSSSRGSSNGDVLFLVVTVVVVVRERVCV